MVILKKHQPSSKNCCGYFLGNVSKIGLLFIEKSGHTNREPDVGATNTVSFWAVVVAQLAERLLPIPEDPGSNPVMGNFYWTINYWQLFREKTKNKEKEARNGPFKKLRQIFARSHWQF